MTEVRWTDEFLSDFRDLSEEEQKLSLEKIEKLEEEGTGIEGVVKASNSEHGLEVWRLKMKDGKVDCRAVFDIIGGEIFLIAVGDRDEIYELRNWKDVARRLREL